MKKITVEYEDIQSFKYDEELIRKGMAYDDFICEIRSILKYEDMSVLLAEYKELMKVEHESMYMKDNPYEYSEENLLYFVIEQMREKLINHLDGD